MNRKITVAGSGYVGMSLSVLLSQNNQVILNDIVAEKVDMVNSRVSPIRDEYIEQYLREKKLHLTAASDKDKAFRDAEFVIVATPTNYDPENDYFDTSSVETVIQEVLERNDTALIVIKSTIPVGFTNEMRAKYATDRITFSPEFLRESQALYENLYPSRIIVADDVSQREKAVEFAALLKEGAMRADAEILYMSASEAESVKLFANTYLALRVGYFNELDTYAELCGLSSERIIKGVSADPRIGSYYNNPSFGYGGYCLPKDTKQLLANFNKQNAPEALIRAVVECNSIRKEHIARQIVLKLGQSGGRGVVGVYRLIMKHNSDNFRGATIIDVLELLKRRGIEVVVYEPCLTSDSFNDCAVVNDIVQFKKECSVIIANRLDDVLGDVAGKVYTRDVFNLN